MSDQQNIPVTNIQLDFFGKDGIISTVKLDPNKITKITLPILVSEVITPMIPMIGKQIEGVEISIYIPIKKQ